MFIKARAVVVACGALMTPPLLLNSGLKNENIGKYLRVHPASTCWGFFPEGVGPKGRFYEGGIMTTFSPVATRKPDEYGGLLETGVFHPSVFAAFHPWQSGRVTFSYFPGQSFQRKGGSLSHNRCTRSDFVINGGIKHASIPL